MRTYDDLTPLWRSTIGFDRLFDLVDAAQHPSSDENYPPCNVERLSDDQYQISLALAGFSPDEVAITAEQNVLTVEGRKADKEQRQYLYQGIPARPFKQAIGAQIRNAGTIPIVTASPFRPYSSCRQKSWRLGRPVSWSSSPR
jgi:HSP20 family molecular chaperone IbpA